MTSTGSGFKPPTELDWYNFETRMRAIVVGLIEPTVQKSADNSQLIAALASEHKEAAERIGFLEELVMEKQGRSQFTEGLIAQVSGLHSKLAVSESNLNSKSHDLSLRLSSVEAKLLCNEDNFAQQRTLLQRVTHDIQSVSSSVANHKDLLLQELAKVNRETTRWAQTHETQIQALFERIQSTNCQLDALIETIPPIEGRLEMLSGSLMDLNKQVQTVKEEKAQVKDHEVIKATVNANMRDTQAALFKLSQEQKEIEMFLDLYIPTVVQCHISDSIFSFADKRLLFRYSQHESEAFKSYREALIASKGVKTLETLRSEIAQRASDIDSRRADFQLSALGQKKEVLSPGSSNKVIRNASTVESEPRLLLRRESVSDEERQPSALQVETAAKVARIEEEIKDLQTCSHRIDKLSSSIDVIDAYTHTLHDEFDAFSLKLKRKKLTHKAEIQTMCKRLGKVEDAISLREKETKTLGDLVADIVEYSLIVHALLDQDEDDRKSIQLTGYRDQLHETPRSRPRPAVLSLDSKCSGCAGISNSGTLAAFKIACLTYCPSPLKYRGTVFSRGEMIAQVGEVLKSAWGRAVARPPFLETKAVIEVRPGAKKKLMRLSASEKPEPPTEKKSFLVKNTPRKRQLSADFPGV